MDAETAAEILERTLRPRVDPGTAAMELVGQLMTSLARAETEARLALNLVEQVRAWQLASLALPAVMLRVLRDNGTLSPEAERTMWESLSDGATHLSPDAEPAWDLAMRTVWMMAGGVPVAPPSGVS